jgi:uncharacterized protein with PQ loop repeat
MGIPQTSFFGWLGMVATLLYKLPQVYKLYKGKTSKGVSLISYSMQTISYLPYAIHGIMIDDLPTFAMGAFSFVLNVILCMQIAFYNKYYDQTQPGYPHTTTTSTVGTSTATATELGRL